MALIIRWPGERRCPNKILSYVFCPRHHDHAIRLPSHWSVAAAAAAAATLRYKNMDIDFMMQKFHLVTALRSLSWQACLIPEQCTRHRTPCKIPNYYVVTSSSMSSEGDPKLGHITQPLDRHTGRHSFIHWIGYTRLLRGRNHLTPHFFHTVTVVGTSSWFPDSHLLVSLYSVLGKH